MNFSKKITQYTLAVSLMLASLVTIAKDLPDFTELAKDSANAVVNISTIKKAKSSEETQRLFEEFEGTPFFDMFRRFWGDIDPKQFGEQDTRSLGSGFILEEDGYVITNYHVIDGADEIVVRLTDRRELPAEVVGSDKGSDLALLKIDAKDLPKLKLADSTDVKVGQWVVAIGSPFGFDHSVTAGIVSATGRNFGQERYVPFIQTDVAINPGNSGGPLLDLDGKVIGVNSHIVTRSGQFGGLSFAIPSEVVKNVVKQLREHGKVSRGWLGLMFQEVNRELAESFGLNKPKGALVVKVLPDSPAQKAGLKGGDVIVKFADKDIDLAGDLPPLVGTLKPGSEVKLEVVRDKKTKKFTVKIGQLPENEDLAMVEDNTVDTTSNKLGMDVREMDSYDHSKLEKDIKGLVITKVRRGGANRAGLRPGDILISIDNEIITSISKFNSVVNKLKDGTTVPILMYRQGTGQRYVAIKIGKD